MVSFTMAMDGKLPHSSCILWPATTAAQAMRTRATTSIQDPPHPHIEGVWRGYRMWRSCCTLGYKLGIGLHLHQHDVRWRQSISISITDISIRPHSRRKQNLHSLVTDGKTLHLHCVLRFVIIYLTLHNLDLSNKMIPMQIIYFIWSDSF